MPTNKRESLIYTVLMCFVMVLWMSVYNVAMQYGHLSGEVVRDAWLGFPVAYVFAMCCDWFLVSGIAKGFAFRFLVKRVEKGALHLLLHGGAHGPHHVPLRCL